MIEISPRQQEHIRQLVRGLRPMLPEEKRLETDALLLEMQENGGLTEDALLRLEKNLEIIKEIDIQDKYSPQQETKPTASTPKAETMVSTEELRRQTRQYIHFLLIWNRKKRQVQSLERKRRL